MLTQYLVDTNNLLQLPGAPVSLYLPANVTSWINKARGQVAGEARCVRRIGTLVTTVGQRAYNFSSITFGDTSVAGTIHARDILYAVGTGYQYIEPHEWEWYRLYYFNNPAPDSGPPERWSQFGQGGSGANITAGGSGGTSSGSIYIDPPPDIPYTLNIDCACYPIPLASDSDPEAIPYLWTDAVPFFAAYYALLSAQTNARMQDAQQYYSLYKEFMTRARMASTPDVVSTLYEQVPDLAQGNKFGMSPSRNGGGGGG